MKNTFYRNVTLVFLITTVLGACAPKEATPTVDIIGTTAAQLAAQMLTQTAGAVTPTPLPPTETPTPEFTATPEAPTEQPVIDPPNVTTFAGCYAGPGDNYTLVSNIDPSIRKAGRQVVTILGIGSVPGWYIIRNPYFNNPCWIKAENLNVDPDMDMTQFPTMTPPP
jgi:hypothetical protein